jgi:hypothetical protein
VGDVLIEPPVGVGVGLAVGLCVGVGLAAGEGLWLGVGLGLALVRLPLREPDGVGEQDGDAVGDEPRLPCFPAGADA